MHIQWIDFNLVRNKDCLTYFIHLQKICNILQGAETTRPHEYERRTRWCQNSPIQDKKIWRFDKGIANCRLATVNISHTVFLSDGALFGSENVPKFSISSYIGNFSYWWQTFHVFCRRSLVWCVNLRPCVLCMILKCMFYF